MAVPRSSGVLTRMRIREPRQRVLLDVRLRVGSGWRDASILNISSRGMMLQSSQPLPTGTFLEIRRGRHTIDARVVWSRGRRFGVRTRDRLELEGIISGIAVTAGKSALKPQSRYTRRHAAGANAAKTLPFRAEASRHHARRAEFFWVGSSAVLGAALLAIAAKGALLRPISAVGAALTAQSHGSVDGRADAPKVLKTASQPTG